MESPKNKESISNILTKEACERLVIGLVISQPDYTNCLYSIHWRPECDLKKLQRIQTLLQKLC